jgi:phosphatidate cytidylyltransferase
VQDLRRRSITAIVYAAVVLVAALAPAIVFVPVLAIISVLAVAELVALRRAGLPVLVEFVLVALGLLALALLRAVSNPPGLLLMTIVAVWAADVGAYLVGSAVGRRKIVPRLSPGKTWEGTIAGFSAAAAVVLLAIPFVKFDLAQVLIAILIGPAAFAGDLAESWVKRRAGVKDSGTLFPGHGGLLDRIDSLLTASVLVVAVILITRRMG